MMKKDLSGYKLYVFDVDGTLYDQPRLRRMMAMRLLGYYMCHPFRVSELLILQHFRKVKDSWTKSSSEEDIIEKTAADMGTQSDRVRAVVKKWIYESPSDVIRKTADIKLIELIRGLREKGKKVVVLSDYPAKDKLDILDVSVDGIYDPDDERIDELKPSSKGLKVIMEDTGASCDEMLMIGDRPEKDEMCASNVNVDCLILPRRVGKRAYNEIWS